MTTAIDARAVPGRRILFTRFSDLDKPDAAKPGVITGLVPEQRSSVQIRLDGSRSTLHAPPDYQGLTYLDETGPVPDLPMGRFTPTVDEMEGEWEGVLLCSIGEDGDVIALTDNHEKAVRAITVYRREMAGCVYDPEFDAVDPDDVKAWWAIFEWQPEDAEMPWTVHWDDDLEGTDHAIRIHHLPA
ncbi:MULTISPECIES: hypothetical protein [unclassified Streptomyces]|uniref:hypothetical protein n=1 Tax=unclassified Streptomyces TaxID=2593676 RepID=UPI0036EBC36D